jgi:hypothetical protein
MNFGSGAVPSIYSRSCTTLQRSFQAYMSSIVRRWDEVWRGFVNIAQSGLASMASGTAGEMLATRGVSHFDRSGSSISLILKRLSSTRLVFCCRDIVTKRPCLVVVLCFLLLTTCDDTCEAMVLLQREDLSFYIVEFLLGSLERPKEYLIERAVAGPRTSLVPSW